MREIWVKIDRSLPSAVKSKLVQSTMGYCSGYIVDPEDIEFVRQLGATVVASRSGGDVFLVDSLQDAVKAKSLGYQIMVMGDVRSGEDVITISNYAEIPCQYIAVKCSDWRVIPIENLIAQTRSKSKLLAFVSSTNEAKLLLEALEVGVDGVVTDIFDPEIVESIYTVLKSTRTRKSEEKEAERLTLVPAKVAELRQLGSGARVCIDTCELMSEGEGMLVGCKSSGLFLVQAEVLETPYIAPRPFRVNAGPVSQYILIPGGKTRYLSELKAGEEVLIVDREGRMRVTNVCRVKVEWRPLILVEALYEGRKVKAILQNAETINLVTPNGHKSLKDIKAGDEVLVHIQEGGRHFGMLVEDEKVIEV